MFRIFKCMSPVSPILNKTSFNPPSFQFISKTIRRVRNSQTSFPSHLIPYPQPATGNRLRHASGPVPRTGNLTSPPVHLFRDMYGVRIEEIIDGFVLCD